MIAAEGEHKASRALRHAAEVIADSPAALQVTRRIMVAMMVGLSGWFGGELTSYGEDRLSQ